MEYKKDLIDNIGVNSTTIAKRGREKKCQWMYWRDFELYFNCDIGDVMSFEE